MGSGQAVLRMTQKSAFVPFFLRKTELLWFLSVKIVPAQAGIRAIGEIYAPVP